MAETETPRQVMRQDALDGLLPDHVHPRRHDLLVERWKVAHAEYRAEVALGWDRMKLFVTLNPVLTAGIVASDARPHTARLALVAAAAVALAGTLIVRRSHSRYQATRAVVLRLEDELGFADLQTTGGQRAAREGPRLEWFRVVDVLAFVFVGIAVLDVALAVTW